MSEALTLPNLDGKLCLVTGGNSGIGRVTATELARAGAHVIIACRSIERTKPILSEMRRAAESERIELMRLDLASFASVRAFAADFLKRDLALHVLVNNAGLAGTRGVTADGFELAFGTNYLGHFLLTNLLVERLEASAPARIVNVASVLHHAARRIDFAAVERKTRTLTGVHEYSVSKLALVLFTKELALRLAGRGLTSYAVHPGAVASDIWRRIWWPARPLAKTVMITPEAGAKTTLYCATAPELATQSGRYYVRCREHRPSRIAQDRALAAELWRRSAEWTGAGA